jgi:hypothetical protein
MISNSDWRPIDWDEWERDVLLRRTMHHGETLGGLVHMVRDVLKWMKVPVEGNKTMSGSRKKTHRWANCVRATFPKTVILFRGAYNPRKDRYEVHALVGQSDYINQDTKNSGTYNGNPPDAVWTATTGLPEVVGFLYRHTGKKLAA